MPYGISSAYAAQETLGKKKTPTEFSPDKRSTPAYLRTPLTFNSGTPYSPYKMKGSPMKRNFGIGDSDMPDKESPFNIVVRPAGVAVGAASQMDWGDDDTGPQAQATPTGGGGGGNVPVHGPESHVKFQDDSEDRKAGMSRAAEVMGWNAGRFRPRQAHELRNMAMGSIIGRGFRGGTGRMGGSIGRFAGMM